MEGLVWFSYMKIVLLSLILSFHSF